jgi:hypothetical protein
MSIGATPDPRVPPSSATAILVILITAIAIKTAFMWSNGERVYRDVNRALSFGALVERDVIAIDQNSIQSKTWVGPLLTYFVYRHGGLNALRTLNIVAFVALFFVQRALGAGRYRPQTTVLALVLMAFYVGTNRNVVAGELEDLLAALSVSLGVLLYVHRGWLLAAALLFGVGFLFKIWVAIFGLGFAAYLLWTRRWHDTLTFAITAGVPFLVLNLVDGFQSARGILFSVGIQLGYSTWAEVAFKLVSTGMVPAVVLSGWMWLKRRRDVDTLFFFVATSYFVYVLLNRDAWSASFVMMLSLVFSAFLIADLVLDAVERMVPAHARAAVIAISILYIAASMAITHLNFQRDTDPLKIYDRPSDIRREFPRSGRKPRRRRRRSTAILRTASSRGRFPTSGRSTTRAPASGIRTTGSIGTTVAERG